MQRAVGVALAFAAPGLVLPTTDPQDIVWARSWIPAELVRAVQSSKNAISAMERMLTLEREALELLATRQYGRPIRFEMIDEDGLRLRQDHGVAEYYVLWRERLDLHPYWKDHLGV